MRKARNSTAIRLDGPPFLIILGPHDHFPFKQHLSRAKARDRLARCTLAIHSNIQSFPMAIGKDPLKQQTRVAHASKDILAMFRLPRGDPVGSPRHCTQLSLSQCGTQSSSKHRDVFFFFFE